MSQVICCHNLRYGERWGGAFERRALTLRREVLPLPTRFLKASIKRPTKAQSRLGWMKSKSVCVRSTRGVLL